MKNISDRLWSGVGTRADDPDLQSLFADLGLPWRTQVGPDRPHDWVAVHNVELGFEFEPNYAGRRAVGDPVSVLQQVSFYAPEAGGRGQIIWPPLEVDYADTRERIRGHLGSKASSVRFASRDVFDFGGRCLVVQVHPSIDRIDSVLALAYRPSRPSAACPPLTFAELWSYIGRPWHDSTLRTRLYSLAASPDAIAQIQRHGTCSLIREAGIKLMFDGDTGSRRLCGIEVYRSRVLDAAEGVHDLPFNITFADSPDDISRKLDGPPAWRRDTNLQSQAWWPLADCRLLATFDLVLNLVSSLTLAKSSYWVSGR